MAERDESEARAAWATDVAVRLAVVGVLVAWCFTLLRPFVALLVWAAILAVALHPVFLWLTRRLGGRGGVAAALLTVVGLLVILGPVGLLLTNLARSAELVFAAVSSGTFASPPPPAGVAAWPWIGADVAALWDEASTNLEAALARLAPQLEAAARQLVLIGANVGIALLQFLAAMIIAGAALPHADGLRDGMAGFAERLTPARGRRFLGLVAATVRNVARGVIGIALLQGLLLGVGFLAAGIPLAGLWTFLAIVLAIVQVGPAPIVLGTIAYAWWALAPLTALLFTLWIVPASLVDNVLRPLIMAQGLPVPMLVVLVGVLGGTLTYGLIGLFVGPVVLALGYEVLRAWVRAERAA